MKILISGSIVLYKSGKGVRDTINSFLNTALDVKLFLIDNSPRNEIKGELSDLLKDKRVEYIFNNRNMGFGAAHNIVLRKVVKLAHYHLVLNPDVYFESSVLEQIFAFIQANKDVGLVIPKVIYPDRNLQYLSKLLPSPFDLIFRRFLPVSFIQKRLYNYEMKFSGYNKKMEVPYISGCFMFMRTSLLSKIGFFDERFFMYLEDIDLSRRFFVVSKNVFLPDIQIIHHHRRGSYKNLRLLFVHIKSAILYFNKWGWWSDKQRDLINNKVIAGIENSALLEKHFEFKSA